MNNEKPLEKSENNEKSEKPKKKKFTKKQENERQEAWMRILVFIVSGIILEVWGFFILVFALVQFILIIVDGKKNKEILEMCKTYVEQVYVFAKYITFISNERPFPFSELVKFKE
jgi:hypothetical protein